MKSFKYFVLILLILTGFSKTAYSQPTLSDSTVRKGFERCVKHVNILEKELDLRDLIISKQDTVVKSYKDSSVIKDKIIAKQSKKIDNKNKWLKGFGIFDAILALGEYLRFRFGL